MLRYQCRAVTGASRPPSPGLTWLPFGGSTIALTISTRIVAASTTSTRPSGLPRNRALSLPGQERPPCCICAADPFRMARIGDFARCRTDGILVRLCPRKQGTQPDTTGHNWASLLHLGFGGAFSGTKRYQQSGASSGFVEGDCCLLRTRREDCPAVGKGKRPAGPSISRGRQRTGLRL